jgi:hypothetical protein
MYSAIVFMNSGAPGFRRKVRGMVPVAGSQGIADRHTDPDDNIYMVCIKLGIWISHFVILNRQVILAFSIR